MHDKTLSKRVLTSLAKIVWKLPALHHHDLFINSPFGWVFRALMSPLLPVIKYSTTSRDIWQSKYRIDMLITYRGCYKSSNYSVVLCCWISWQIYWQIIYSFIVWKAGLRTWFYINFWKEPVVVVTLYVFRSHADMNQAHVQIGDFVYVGPELENEWLLYMTWLFSTALWLVSYALAPTMTKYMISNFTSVRCFLS